ncbi:MAG: Rne/Rng family ribonuclease [Acidobacteria bacterium]|nr:Rne/Rng family ribonuclease [Acidobacteriota bacterium]
MRLLVESDPQRIRIALLEGERLAELHLEDQRASRVGEVYLGRVQRMAPAIDAAFVDIGLGRNAFLHADDFGLGDSSQEIRIHQPIIVQVSRDELPGKGARVRRGATLPGRYLVLLAVGGGVAVSTRIHDDDERQRLIAATERVADRDLGWIIRTAALGVEESELEREAATLHERWLDIKGAAATTKAPCCLHRDLDGIERWLRDRACEELAEIWVDSEALENAVTATLAQIAPALVERVRVHRAAPSLFERFGVERQLGCLWDRRVGLPAGGSLVIESTEALVAVDVNSGRDLGAGSLEETALATNREAALEVARQIRLRDLAGIIVVDFIDMSDGSGWDEVLQILEDELERDRAATMVEGPVAFGLVAITRKRGRNDLVHRLSVECSECLGSGRLPSPAEIASRARRALLAHEAAQPGRSWRLRLHSSVAAQLENSASPILAELGERLGERLSVEGVPDVGRATFELLERR